MTDDNNDVRRATMVSVEAFAAQTPDVPAERIECAECGEVYIGDPADGNTGPCCDGWSA